jgi:hypothetical protein
MFWILALLLILPGTFFMALAFGEGGTGPVGRTIGWLGTIVYLAIIVGLLVL